MSEIVFILGAGASREGGGPLMNDFLDIAHDLHRMGLTGECAADFEGVLHARAQLQNAASKIALDVHNVEAVFAAFEMGRVLGRGAVAWQGGVESSSLVVSMQRVITEVIRQRIRFPLDGDGLVCPPAPYGEFGELAAALLKGDGDRRTISIISFNYDVGVEFGLTRVGLVPEYYVEEPPVEESPGPHRVPVLKLHGSLNWRRSSSGDVAYWRFARGYGHQGEFERSPGQNFALLNCDVARKHWFGGAVGDEDGVEPLVVPPTWNKLDYQKLLCNVWRRAAQEISEAETIIVCGYSLPPTDEFFRYLLALGAVGGPVIREFHVYDPDTSGNVEARFRRLLGSAAVARFHYSSMKFRESIAALKKGLCDDDENFLF